MLARMPLEKKAVSTTSVSFPPVRQAFIQRKCSCGGVPGVDGNCSACREKSLSSQRVPANHNAFSAESHSSSALHDSSTLTNNASSGAYAGHDFSRIPIYHVGQQTGEPIPSQFKELTRPNQQTTANTSEPRQDSSVRDNVGNSHELTNARFVGDPDLQAAYDNKQLIGNESHGLAVKSRGPAIKKIQEALLDLHFPLPIFGADGSFGDETEKAVKNFQKREGLTGRDVDGIIGPITMGLLDKDAPPPAPKPKPVSECPDAGDISEERDPLPPYTPFNPIALPVPVVRQEAAKLNPGQHIPPVVLGATKPQLNDADVKPVTVTALPVPGSTCMKCVAEWELPRPPIISFVAATGSFTLPEVRFWANIDENRTGCPSFGTFGDRKEVREIIDSDAQARIEFGELEHWLDAQFAFDIVGGRYLANVRRLTPERTHLRGKDQKDCETKVGNFLRRMIVSLIGEYHENFLADYKLIEPQTGKRDDSGQHTAHPEPSTDKSPFPPDLDLAKNPFGCTAFWRKLTNQSFSGIPGPPSSEVILLPADKVPPKKPWHEF